MGGVSKEQIAAARQIDLLTYMLNCEPNAIRKCGSNTYELVEHDSLRISNGKWYWHSRGFGAASALDFLIKVRGIDFVNAVETILESRATPLFSFAPVNTLPEKPKPPFILPEKFWNNFRVIAYLQNRGIDYEIIDHCINNKVLYESKEHHNCVFVGRDNKNKAQFACLRGIYGRFMLDVKGSNKKYSFSVPTENANIKVLAVFESPIDALSHATLCKQVKDNLTWNCVHRLSLGGTSPVSLMHYLKEYPNIDTIELCLDNDETGKKTVQKIKNMLDEITTPFNGKYIVKVTPPLVGKDYNDTLLANLSERKQQQTKIEVNQKSL